MTSAVANATDAAGALGASYRAKYNGEVHRLLQAVPATFGYYSQKEIEYAGRSRGLTVTSDTHGLALGGKGNDPSRILIDRRLAAGDRKAECDRAAVHLAAQIIGDFRYSRQECEAFVSAFLGSTPAAAAPAPSPAAQPREGSTSGTANAYLAGKQHYRLTHGDKSLLTYETCNATMTFVSRADLKRYSGRNVVGLSRRGSAADGRNEIFIAQDLEGRQRDLTWVHECAHLIDSGYTEDEAEAFGAGYLSGW